MQALARCTVALMVAVFSIISVGELAVEAMNAPTILPHSQAHVMGFMCKGGGRGVGPQAETPETNPAYKYRIADYVRPGFFFNQDDPAVGILDYTQKTDCELSARLLNNRYRFARFYCVSVKVN